MQHFEGEDREQRGYRESDELRPPVKVELD